MNELPVISRTLISKIEMKYGCNPNQKPAAAYMDEGRALPFEVLNGKPGYINFCDALNAWQLVRELRAALGMPAAASFKHVSPAGAAIAAPLDDTLRRVYECEGEDFSPLAIAYVRARGADPMCSFGDFIALSDVVDESAARVIGGAVSDGVIAPGYEPKALEILKGKKGGAYPVITMDLSYQPPEIEMRDIFGVTLAQRRNDVRIDRSLLNNIVTKNKAIPESAVLDLIATTIAVKFTQSNSVGYGLGGQVIGLGAGQQSRVDCVKLAGRKVETWWLRQHPKVLGLKFKPEVKRQERINARVRYIEGDMTGPEKKAWLEGLASDPGPLTLEEKAEWMTKLKGVSLSSDAFFPFRDNIDQASRRGVKYIVATGGSTRDAEVIAAANEYGMVMAFSGVRLFHH
ncbi:MAG: phosphoribosylaminoimidazolecarboxamide formyltransferase [Candidatus Sumerlaeota bacterium]|nr:phosphoribosylaminoimidazolecarboxamide formyltransferase [Candidatus Sumerlaeota bacterium]